MGWKRRPTGFIPVAEGELNAMTRAIALQALTGVVLASPVDSGAFRGSHTISVNAIDPSFDTTKVDKPGQATISAGAGKIGGALDPYQIIYVQSNLPYAETIEFGGFSGPTEKVTADGFSEQAPKGVYQVTFDSLRAATE